MAEVPKCPITLEPLEDPVIASDGVTYERVAIEAWIRENGTSPQTREALRIEDLVPNRALRDMVAELRHDNSVNLEDKSKVNLSPHQLTSPQDIYEHLSTAVSTTARMSTATNSDQVVLHVDVPDSSKCTFPNHICCVIDVSGSMQLEAPCKDETGQETSTGLSVLDVVKYAALVISQSLGPIDQLSIVTFSNEARTVLPPTCMDENGKKLAKTALNSISVEGMTNLWAGLSEGVKLACQVGPDFNNSVFVLTDGLPNVDPPLGYKRSMERLLAKHRIYGSVSTFGFGYSLDSCLLNDLSRLGGGCFSFIPDAGFVGTCFINAVANTRCAFGLRPRVKINRVIREDDFGCVTADGQLCVEKVDDGDRATHIRLTPLRYGQAIDIVLNGEFINIDDGMELEFNTVSGQAVTIPVGLVRADSGFRIEDDFHSLRAKFVRDAHKASGERPISSGASRGGNKVTRFEALPVQEVSSVRKSKKLSALIEDIEGQATEALQDDYFGRWGRHYHLSLSGAHLHQFCNNFKDPGVQLYGTGSLFRSLQEDLNDIFETLPPPKPSAHRRRPGPAITSMTRTFNNRNVVCVHGNTSVVVSKDEASEGLPSRIPISKIQRGDRVLTASNNAFAGVRCVIQTIAKSGSVNKKEPLVMVRIKQLVVTPYHPVFFGGEWKFPIDVQEGDLVELGDCDSVYNLVLDDDHRSSAVLMDGIPCITLGHGIKDGDFLPHPFFGTSLITDNLEAGFPSAWEEGHIILSESNVRRAGPNGTGPICGFVPTVAVAT